MKVAVTGATGFIGTALVGKLRERGDSVTVLTRNPERAKQLGEVTVIAAELEEPGPWWDALASVDGIVHLAGEAIAGKRWDARQKQIIRDSRVESTSMIVAAIAKAAVKPKVLVTASGADYYPFATDLTDFDDDAVTEADPPGDSFLGRLCRDWEKEARAAEAFGVRVVSMRTGLVIGPGGGLGKMVTPFKLFVGGRIGSGRQWMSWIHRDDVVAGYLAALSDDRYKGPINLVTDSVRNAVFAQTLGRVMHRPSWLPVPKFAIKAAAGELSEYILNGRKVVPKQLLDLGFTWQHRELAEALASMT
ncbi:MAG: hypothetical protein JWO36_1778 [Myxococcales bacterium]|nr:hypothetical protein [Myxococcales bacterium]